MFVDEQSFNPFYMLNEILGPALCAKVMCCLVCLIVIAACIFGAPFVSAVDELFNLLPSPLGLILLVGIAIVICGTSAATALHHFCRGDKKKGKNKKKQKAARRV